MISLSIATMKILIIQTAFIGDAILSTSLIEKLKAEFPNSSISFLIRKGNEGLFTNHPHIDDLLIFNKKEHKYRNLIQLIKTIRKSRFDYVINVQRFFTTGLITALSKGKTKIGYRKNPLSWTFDQRVEHNIGAKGDDKTTHEVARNLSLLSSFISNKETSLPRLYPGKEDYQKVHDNHPYVCIAPASVWFTKQLPSVKWVELISKLPSDIRVYLIGGPGDIDLCQSIADLLPEKDIVVKAGVLSFLASAALISKAQMTFANDSAPVHIASAMNAPITEIFCSTIPAFGFGPLSDVSFSIETKKELSCRPCGLHGKKSCPEGHFKCADIDIDQMLSKVKLH